MKAFHGAATHSRRLALWMNSMIIGHVKWPAPLMPSSCAVTGVGAPRDLCDFVSCDTAAALDHALLVPACKSRLDDEPGRRSG